MWILGLVFLGRELFTTKHLTIDAHPVLESALTAVLIAASALKGWAFMLLLNCVGEVQGFSTWRALGSLLLGFAVVVAPLMLVALVFLR
jgi:hypothetical protein